MQIVGRGTASSTSCQIMSGLRKTNDNPDPGVLSRSIQGRPLVRAIGQSDLAFHLACGHPTAGVSSSGNSSHEITSMNNDSWLSMRDIGA